MTGRKGNLPMSPGTNELVPIGTSSRPLLRLKTPLIRYQGIPIRFDGAKVMSKLIPEPPEHA